MDNASYDNNGLHGLDVGHTHNDVVLNVARTTTRAVFLLRFLASWTIQADDDEDSDSLPSLVDSDSDDIDLGDDIDRDDPDAQQGPD